MIRFNLVERMLFEKLKIGKLCLFSGKLMSDLLYPTAKSLKQSQRVNFIYIKDSLELDRCLSWDRHRLGGSMTVDKIPHSVSPRFVLTNVSYSRTFRTRSIRAQIQIYPVYVGLCPTHRSIRTRLNIHKVTIKSQEIS